MTKLNEASNKVSSPPGAGESWSLGGQRGWSHHPENQLVPLA